MAEEKITSRIEIDSEFSEQVMRDIGSLREELVTIRELLERGHSLDRAIEEYRYLPSNLKNPFRWGFIGAWGKGGSDYVVSIHTTTEEDFFDDPNASDKNVAALAAALTNPNTIKICRYLFRNKEHSREEIKKGCNLSDEELDAAVKPLLEWHFVHWKDEKLKVEHGVHYVVTLIEMTKGAISHKVSREQG